MVISAFEGYAYDAGVRPGDVLETVNGQPVVNLGVSATSDLLRGDPGTPVSITVARTGEAAPLSFSLTRRRVVIKDVPVAALLGAPADGVAYIRLASFARDAAEECRFALRGLDAAVKEAGGPGVTSLVLDLRGNPGGLLTSAVEVAEVVLPKGSVVVSTKGRGLGQEPRYVSSADPAIGPAVRLAVLVNGGTASASEIVAGAVQDLDRGVVVGSRTFGKGLVQNVQTLPYDTALKVRQQARREKAWGRGAEPVRCAATVCRTCPPIGRLCCWGRFVEHCQGIPVVFLWSDTHCDRLLAGCVPCNGTSPERIATDRFPVLLLPVWHLVFLNARPLCPPLPWRLPLRAYTHSIPLASTIHQVDDASRPPTTAPPR